ncbi:MAG: carboxypeptidase regulatory-like domain-containing protein [Acidobacteriaceae bacterium]
MRWLVVVLFLVVPVVLTPFTMMAQQPPASTTATAGATVHGMVVDPDDALIPGATVTLTPATGRAQTTTSKSDGTYSFRVPAGTYTLSVKASGFADFTKPAIQVATGANLNVDASMALAEQQQQVNVTTDTVTLSVDSDSNASATVITGAALDALSDDPDDLLSELQALAGPSAGPNGGQIYIDGFTGGELPPKSSILAIRINQNPFSAQYPELGYGRIEVITKPGTSAFHGNFTSQFQDKFLNTSNPFLGTQNIQPPYHTLFFMGNVTGPIRNGMSFTLSGSRRVMDNISIFNPQGGFYASSATSPTLCAPGNTGASASCTAYVFPYADRAIRSPATRWDISPRMDMMLGAKNTMTTRYEYEAGSNSTNPPVSSALLAPSSSSSKDQEVQISDTQLWSSKIINETRFEYERSTSNSLTPGNSPSISVGGGGFSVSSGSQSSNTSDHEEFQNYTSIQLTNNFIRFGARLVSGGESNFTAGGSAYGSYSYNYLLDPCTDPNLTSRPSNCLPTPVAPACSTANMAAIPNTTPVQYYPVYSSYQCNIVNTFGIKDIYVPTISARETDVGFYAEDDWKAKPNLTISYGMRYEAQNVINSSHDIAPRVAFAYGIPRKNGKTTTVIRGGYGFFFNRFGLNSIEGQIANNGTNAQSFTYLNPSATSCTPASNYSNGFFTQYTGTGCTSGSGTSGAVTPTVNAPNLRSTYNMEVAATLEQQVGKYASVTVTYLNARGFHQFVTRQIPLTDSLGNPVLDSSGNVQMQNINQSEGIYRQNQINTNINIRTPKGTNIFGYYSANWANSNDAQMSDVFSSSVDYGRARFGVRSRLTLGGSIPLPFNISASPMLTASSGSPYNITTGLPEQITLPGVAKPVTIAGTARPSWNPAFGPMPAYGSWSQCTKSIPTTDFTNDTPTTQYVPGGVNDQIPLNFCTGPASVSLNLRLARTIGFGPKTAAALSAEQAARQQARQQAGGGPGGPGGPGGGPGGGGFGGGGGGRGGGGGGGGRGGGGGGGFGGGGGRGGGSNTGRKYNLTLGVQAFNVFNEVPYSSPVGSLNNQYFGKTTSINGGNAVRRITLQASFSF